MTVRRRLPSLEASLFAPQNDDVFDWPVMEAVAWLCLELDLDLEKTTSSLAIDFHMLGQTHSFRATGEKLISSSLQDKTC